MRRVHVLKWRYHDCILSSSVLHRPRGIRSVSLVFLAPLFWRTAVGRMAERHPRVPPPPPPSMFSFWSDGFIGLFRSPGGPLAEDCCCLYPGSFLSPWQCWPFCKFLPLVAPKHDVFVSPVGTRGCALAWLLMWPLRQFLCLTWRFFFFFFSHLISRGVWCFDLVVCKQTSITGLFSLGCFNIEKSQNIRSACFLFFLLWL